MLKFKEITRESKIQKIDGKLPILGSTNTYCQDFINYLSYQFEVDFKNKIIIPHTSAEPENMLWYMNIHCGFVPLSACRNKG